MTAVSSEISEKVRRRLISLSWASGNRLSSSLVELLADLDVLLTSAHNLLAPGRAGGAVSRIVRSSSPSRGPAVRRCPVTVISSCIHVADRPYEIDALLDDAHVVPDGA